MQGGRYQEQGLGEMVPGRGIELVELLERRDGRLTLLELADGRTIRSFNIAAGRDLGDEWEHFTLNISPRIDGEDVDWLSTADVVAASDPDGSEPLYRRIDA
jgi:hypothetical protein